MLGELAAESLQLTRIESRPTKEWLGIYVFLVDLHGHRLDPPVARALDRLCTRSATLKVFGSYPRYPLESLRELVEPPPT
jgi:prephenate dehydratase